MTQSNSVETKTPFEENVIVMAVKNQINRDLGGETVILNIDTGIYCGLNAVGTRIWEIIQKPVKVKEINDAMLREYDVEPERCGKEIADILKALLNAKLIEIKNETAA